MRHVAYNTGGLIEERNIRHEYVKSREEQMSLISSEQERIRTTCKKLLHRGSTRRTCLLFLAGSVKFANSLDPERWGLTLNEGFIRLNVGMIEVLAFYPDRGHCLLDLDTMPMDLRLDRRVALTEDVLNPSRGVYKSVPGSIILNAAAADFVDLMPVIQGSHRVLVDHASETRRNPATKNAHSKELIEYLASYLEQDIPQPGYIL